ncbi:hypothetical protein P280DRAFT_171215 [Massarina eburnea CBS 473.64]|uniref:Myb-like domain-containing protein n=1 Tax=Massarina eburnea CBS 473.64 TaxID=1395130 RepID=A0A6A6SE06_9PLEO|nr:hypothetical protein P280DRAFT_171215 [Massarina eburnea CBS 473.64]
MLHHQPQILSPLAEMDPHASSTSGLRARKMSSAGGNRSWSEEEENYLLQTRMQKMPYKHIAAHLKKTELACRLHFHQLSHGSHRRKRTSSVSSVASCSSVQSAYGMGMDHDAYSQSSRHGSPVSYTGSPHVRSASVSTSPGRSQHKILLPKPRPLTPRESPEPHNALRINTEVVHHPKVVDTDRLRAIYEARRQQFWATVAADYGADVSPAQLEEFWRTGSNGVRPPTPDASPDGSIMLNPVLKPSPFSYASPISDLKHYSQLNISAVSTPERMPYMLPMPVPSAGRPRAGTWSSAPRDNVPIASLLTEDKNPRAQ